VPFFVSFLMAGVVLLLKVTLDSLSGPWLFPLLVTAGGAVYFMVYWCCDKTSILEIKSLLQGDS